MGLVLADPFVVSKLLATVLVLFLIGWALWRSRLEDAQLGYKIDEPDSRGARLSRRIGLLLAVAFFLELQPVVLDWLIEASRSEENAGGRLQAVIAAAAAVIAVTAPFRARLLTLIQKAAGVASIGARLQAVLARLAFLALGLAVPILVYALFLWIVLFGIMVAEQPAGPNLLLLALNQVPAGQALPAFVHGLLAVSGLDAVPLATATEGIGRLAETPLTVHIRTVELALLAVLAALFAMSAAAAAETPPQLSRLAALLMLVHRHGIRWPAVFGVAAAFLLGVLAAIATRGDDELLWDVLFSFVLLSAIAIVIGAHYTENANGLHRLYRDRLSAAFGLAGHPDQRTIWLDRLPERAPYLLINAALNVRRGRPAAKTAASQPAVGAKLTDPAARGRNAEFFVFSRLFVGSDLTGYARSTNMANLDPQLDLATATAISAAAISSSMGRIDIGLLGPTLALLNLRLGYWLVNPKVLSSGSLPGSWDEMLRLYLFTEAFGRLGARGPKIYVTDGGHIDNLGLYQLLKRRCRLIIVVDAEADPGLTFGAFADVQRFARIDLGIRINLDWRGIRSAGLKRKEDAAAGTAERNDAAHVAVGRIDYGGSDSGVLLYVKASVSGDEPDYVLDYERRYQDVPHEPTGDQFYSEEQMEAYRALGFHILGRALPPELAPMPAGGGAAAGPPETLGSPSAAPPGRPRADGGSGGAEPELPPGVTVAALIAALERLARPADP